jgi:hypothetical protein
MRNAQQRIQIHTNILIFQGRTNAGDLPMRSRARQFCQDWSLVP